MCMCTVITVCVCPVKLCNSKNNSKHTHTHPPTQRQCVAYLPTVGTGSILLDCANFQYRWPQLELDENICSICNFSQKLSNRMLHGMVPWTCATQKSFVPILRQEQKDARPDRCSARILNVNEMLSVAHSRANWPSMFVCLIYAVVVSVERFNMPTRKHTDSMLLMCVVCVYG